MFYAAPGLVGHTEVAGLLPFHEVVVMEKIFPGKLILTPRVALLTAEGSHLQCKL